MNGAVSALLDRLSMICGVFLLCMGGCLLMDTRPILAPLCFTFAVLFPSIVERSREQYNSLVARRPTDGTDDREGN